jgi:hypothetical protein
LHDLGDGIGDEAMIGMAVAALGPPSDDDLRMKLLYEFLGVVCDGVDVFGERIGDGAKFAVVEVEKDRGLDAELLASAGGFGATRGREGFAGGNLGEVGGSLFAFGSDGEVDVDAFAGVSRKVGPAKTSSSGWAKTARRTWECEGASCWAKRKAASSDEASRIKSLMMRVLCEIDAVLARTLPPWRSQNYKDSQALHSAAPESP